MVLLEGDSPGRASWVVVVITPKGKGAAWLRFSDIGRVLNMESGRREFVLVGRHHKVTKPYDHEPFVELTYLCTLELINLIHPGTHDCVQYFVTYRISSLASSFHLLTFILGMLLSLWGAMMRRYHMGGEAIPRVNEDHEVPAEEVSHYPSIDSPTAESPGYVTESDPEEDPEEYEDDETEDGPVDYPMDGGDDGDDDDDDSSRMDDAKLMRWG
ncbi:hypothetical protein Tco_0652031 [Tanacetum coccineum]|uniref:Uncharacterized protein n=1 Tax=Tanacetum coccineum TaxID=301880 RepID=A0ABQ4WWH4_9ASTR